MTDKVQAAQYRGMRAPLSERFWRYVTRGAPDACWLWRGSMTPDGYGQICAEKRKRMIPSHRAAHMLLVGPIPNGLHVLHRCDVRACVNPAHLFLGTNLDNIRDREAKGRGKVPPHGRSKLTVEQVKAIRASADSAARQELAQRFGVSRSAVDDILSGRRWRSILDPKGAREPTP